MVLVTTILIAIWFSSTPLYPPLLLQRLTLWFEWKVSTTVGWIVICKTWNRENSHYTHRMNTDDIDRSLTFHLEPCAGQTCTSHPYIYLMGWHKNLVPRQWILMTVIHWLVIRGFDLNFTKSQTLGKENHVNGQTFIVYWYAFIQFIYLWWY